MSISVCLRIAWRTGLRTANGTASRVGEFAAGDLPAGVDRPQDQVEEERQVEAEVFPACRARAGRTGCR